MEKQMDRTSIQKLYVIYFSLCFLADIKPFSVWWSTNRIDYALEMAQFTDSFDLLPPAAFAHIMHSRYWEAKELVSFILRQVC